MVWAGWLYSQEWWRQELWRTTSPAGTTFEQAVETFRKRFSADANNYILQARTWQRHDVGATPGFDGSVEKALRSIKARVLYMPSETDLYFPITDARYEQALIPRVTFAPIPSLWGHTAGARAIRRTCAFLNESHRRVLESEISLQDHAASSLRTLRRETPSAIPLLARCRYTDNCRTCRGRRRRGRRRRMALADRAKYSA